MSLFHKEVKRKHYISKKIFIANQLLSLVRNDRPHLSTANKIFTVYAPVVEQIYCSFSFLHVDTTGPELNMLLFFQYSQVKGWVLGPVRGYIVK